LKRYTVGWVFQVKETDTLSSCERLSQGGLAGLTGAQEGDGRRTLSTVLNRLEQVLARYHHSNLVQQFPNCNDAGGGVVSL
jgi:hypothetical protein